MPSLLADPVKLPCGLVLPNRLSKAAMAEMIAKTNQPTTALADAYEQWSDGGWGSILTGKVWPKATMLVEISVANAKPSSPNIDPDPNPTLHFPKTLPTTKPNLITSPGNVQVDVNHMGGPYDPALHSEYTDSETNSAIVAEWKKYADTCQKHGTPAIAQICHPGRQSFRVAGYRGIFAQTLAPSAVPIEVGDSYLESLVGYLVWSKPKEMTTQDIERVIRQFVDTARLMADAGFSGIELHGAHGYLIDHSSSTFEETMTQIALLAEAGLDFMEISGGTYEDPKMMGYGKADPAAAPKSARTAAREAFFLEFSKVVRQRHPGLVLMLTGGFRSRAGAEAAVRDGACDLVGIGRPAAIDPRFPCLLLDESVGDEQAQLVLNKVAVPWYTRFLPLHLIGAGAESTYYSAQIQKLGKGIAAIAPPW
ncbi:Aldolase-type TIM barrel [Penicillium italicum]|uniref:Aldolase-type TIM barrel n=1 Tax=Penicillium italicum TaxID=40296 RepID=A0A0A2KKQ7_PENIT|nr:Aldolase-type TIM barrel [Penicillium italicum]